MKFHHLARHSQFVGALQRERDLSPAKQLHQQAANLQTQKHQHQQQQQPVAGLTEDEDDEFNDVQTFYDVMDQQQQQQQQQAANNGQLLDTSGFLMDKNKKLFPQKLWELIHNPSIQHCLRWSQDGQRVYLNRNEFEAYYLKTPNNQFHTQKAISFVRQMNMYGFRKVDDCYYENDNFRRDRQHLLRNMIRRHPNKGLFVGLDHHQLAAAAAAQQALQVNQQLQQLEHQHKHRTEQALRINSYLNNHHHRFHQSSLVGQQQQQHQLGDHTQHNHSTSFEQMSSQLAQAAANHLSQQQQQHHQSQLNNNLAMTNANSSTQNGLNPLGASSPGGVHLQPKKSRLLSNFYGAATGTGNNLVSTSNLRAHNYCSDNAASNQLQMHNQDSMHSNSSVDTQPSQCSSVVNSGSAGSPRPNSPANLHQRLANLNANRHHHHHHQQSGSSSSTAAAIRAAVLAARQDSSSIQQVANKFVASQNTVNLNQHAATDLSKQSLASRQALHQTLVRSLLQLKQQSHQHPQDLLASLQQQNPRSLLESLASLSSVGTGSIVDPTSTPTERTATPPSSSPSSETGSGRDQDSYQQVSRGASLEYLDNNNIALDLAKSSSASFGNLAKRQLNSIARQHDGDDGAADFVIAGRGEETELEEDNDVVDDGNAIKSPLDGARKVRRFLDNQMVTQKHVSLGEEDEDLPASLKRELISPDLVTLKEDNLPQKKRIKLDDNFNNNITADKLGIDSIAKSLILELCERQGNRLDVTALQEAARYTQCFLDILLEDAALIAGHSSVVADEIAKQEDGDIDSDKGGADEEGQAAEEGELDCDKLASSDQTKGKEKTKSNVAIVDSSSLSLALKLIPSKLLAAIQQQATMKLQS